MDIKSGTVVRSVAGHDKGELMLLLATDSKSALVCDGRQRRLEKPKRKNLKHIKATSFTLSEEETQSNKRLRKALFRLMNSPENQEA